MERITKHRIFFLSIVFLIIGVLFLLTISCDNKIGTIDCKQQIEKPINDIIIIDGVVMVIPRSER